MGRKKREIWQVWKGRGGGGICIVSMCHSNACSGICSTQKADCGYSLVDVGSNILLNCNGFIPWKCLPELCLIH